MKLRFHTARLPARPTEGTLCTPTFCCLGQSFDSSFGPSATTPFLRRLSTCKQLLRLLLLALKAMLAARLGASDVEKPFSRSTCTRRAMKHLYPPPRRLACLPASFVFPPGTGQGLGLSKSQPQAVFIQFLGLRQGVQLKSEPESLILTPMLQADFSQTFCHQPSFSSSLCQKLGPAHKARGSAEFGCRCGLKYTWRASAWVVT